MLILLRQLGIHVPRPSFSISNCVGICCLTCSQKNIRAPNLLSFKGVPSLPSWCLQGYFYSLSINLEDIDHSVFQAASLSQAMSQDSKSYFECSIWISTVKCNAHSFSHYNFQNQKITMLEMIGYITELTAWHFCHGHMSGTFVWWGGNRTHFFQADT